MLCVLNTFFEMPRVYKITCVPQSIRYGIFQVDDGTSTGRMYAEDTNVIKFLSISPSTLHEIAIASKKCKSTIKRVRIWGHDATKSVISKSAMEELCSNSSMGHEFEVQCYAFDKNEENGCKLQAISVNCCDSRSEVRRLLDALKK